MRRLLLASALAASACAADPDLDSPLASEESPIIRGVVMDADWLGAVRLYAGDFLAGESCSGKLLTNQWVVSAKHCFAEDHPVPTEMIRIITGGKQDPDQPPGVLTAMQTARAIQRVDHPTLDISLFKLNVPFWMFFSPTGYRAQISDAPAASYVGGFINCFGFGRYYYSTLIDGQLRGAKMPVVRTEQNGTQLIMVPNAPTEPQRPWTGDSGGMCVGWDGKIAAIMSGHSYELSPDQFNIAVNASSFKAWAEEWIQR